MKVDHIGGNVVVDELAQKEPLHRNKRLEDTLWHLYLIRKKMVFACRGLTAEALVPNEVTHM